MNVRIFVVAVICGARVVIVIVIVIVIGEVQVRAIIATMVTVGTVRVSHHSVGNDTDQKQSQN